MEAIKRKLSRVVYRLLLNGGYQIKALQGCIYIIIKWRLSKESCPGLYMDSNESSPYIHPWRAFV
jgi:hypothetical protein